MFAAYQSLPNGRLKHDLNEPTFDAKRSFFQKRRKEFFRLYLLLTRLSLAEGLPALWPQLRQRAGVESLCFAGVYGTIQVYRSLRRNKN
jgi:hypothetical protein